MLKNPSFFLFIYFYGSRLFTCCTWNLGPIRQLYASIAGWIWTPKLLHVCVLDLEVEVQKESRGGVCVDVCVCSNNSNNKYCPSSTSTAAVNVQGLDWLPHPSEPGGGKEGAKGRDFQFIFTVNRDVRDS